MLHLLPLSVLLASQLAVSMADPFMRDLPRIGYAVPSGAPDEVGRASTYGRANDSRRQSLMASAGHVRVDSTTHTCAHRSHVFGTVLALQSVSSRRVTYCKVTDRGPYGCIDPDTGERLNLAILRRDHDPRAVSCVPRGILDLAPAVRARLAPGDGGLHAVRAWVVHRPRRAVRVRRPS